MKLIPVLLFPALFVGGAPSEDYSSLRGHPDQTKRKLQACGIPRFIGKWVKNNITYPIGNSEAQGGMIGNDFLVVSGFHDANGSIRNATRNNWVRDATTPETQWRPIDPLPTPYGITHGASVVVGTMFYMCGGYIGGHPGPQTADCLAYNHSAPAGSQWSFLPPLPQGRAGGGMIYDKLSNALVFSGGAQRPKVGNAYAIDFTDTWLLSLDNVGAGWQPRTALPFRANHMGSVTVQDAIAGEHHFFTGGQHGEFEKTGNLDENWEYIVATDQWTKHASLPFTRGHISSSTRAMGCGYFQAGGTSNGCVDCGVWGTLANGSKTNDISFYDMTTDTWTKLGNLTSPINTPVCDVSPAGLGEQWLYCETGWSGSRFSYRRRIELVPN